MTRARDGSPEGRDAEGGSTAQPRQPGPEGERPNAAALTQREEEIERLRGALKEIAAMGGGRKLNWGDAQDAIETARAALLPISSEEPR